MDYRIIIVCSLLCVFASLVESRGCAKGQYYDHELETCTKCSECPIDEIIRRPCTRHLDTICGPFFEFEFFNHLNEPKEMRGESSEDGQMAQVEEEEEKEEIMNLDESAEPTDEQAPLPSLAQEASTWRHLCYGLMGALLLIVMVIIMYILVVHIRRRHRAGILAGKTITVADPADPTVYYQAQIINETSSSSASSPMLLPSSRSSAATASEKSSSTNSLSALESHLRRMLFTANSRNSHTPAAPGNVYVDPMGRLYTRDDTYRSVPTHPFVRIVDDHGTAVSQIYTGPAASSSSRSSSPRGDAAV